MNVENTIAILVTTLFVVVATIIPTFIISNRQKTTAEGWAIADRSLPLYVVVGTQLASLMGGGILVGHLGNAYANGVGILLYNILGGIGFLIIMIIARWLRHNNFTTIPEIIGSFTNKNKTVAVITAFMTLVVPFGWVTSQITAFGSIYSGLTGIDYNVLCIAFAVISLLFIMPSGLKTVAWTDFIFSCFMIVICIVSAVYAASLGGGVANITANIQKIDPNLLSMSGSLTENIGTTTVFLWIFAILPGGLTNQIYFQRVCAIKDESKVNTSLLLTAFLSFLSFVWAVFMGISIRSINPTIENNAATAWFMDQLPLGLLALFAALIFATLMSTASSGIQTTVVNITHDILPVFMPDITEDQKLKWSRGLSAGLMGLAIVMCLIFTDTLGWLVATYAFSAATLACPIFVSYAMRNKKFITTEGIVAGIAGGALGCALGMIFETQVSYAAVGMGLSFFAMIVGCMLTKNKHYANVD